MMEVTDRDFYDTVRKARAEGDPVARYIKVIKGRLQVRVLDAFAGKPKNMMLKGDPTNPDLDREEIMIICWTDMEDEYFRKSNKELIEKGYMAPYSEKVEEEIAVNEVSDAELEEALSKPFFAAKALLDQFTSPQPVKRMLNIAQEMNKKVGTVNAIKERLSELQKTE